MAGGPRCGLNGDHRDVELDDLKRQVWQLQEQLEKSHLLRCDNPYYDWRRRQQRGDFPFHDVCSSTSNEEAPLRHPHRYHNSYDFDVNVDISKDCNWLETTERAFGYKNVAENQEHEAKKEIPIRLYPSFDETYDAMFGVFNNIGFQVRQYFNFVLNNFISITTAYRVSPRKWISSSRVGKVQQKIDGSFWGLQRVDDNAYKI